MVTGFDIIGSDKNLQEHWIRRAVAYIIDIIVLAVILWVIFWILLGWPRWLEVGLLSGLIMILYFTIFEATSNKTLGKAILNLEVSATQGYMDFQKAFVRNISKFFWFILPFLDWVIGMVTEGDPRQRFLDRIANTVVVSSYGIPVGYGQRSAPGANPLSQQSPTEKCLYCGAPLTELEGGRFQCTSCGIIQ
jgi:uncharacterized RDD family membrane protein YckC